MNDGRKTALVLTGGGARAAYQVGVLQGVSSILCKAGWETWRNPYDIICGTSAGAINATALACRADDFGESLRQVAQVWENFSVEQVYRADSLSVLRTGARWLLLLSFGWLVRKWRASPPSALLDNSPLAELLNRMLDFQRLERALSSGALHALAVSAFSYTTGRHITFFQTETELVPWTRTQRVAMRSRIAIDNLLASSAIPLIFPAMPVACNGRREYCGDGSMRQLAPISPAIRLGADRLLIVGAGRLKETTEPAIGNAQYPTLAQIAGHALSGIFLDTLAVDIERMNRINATLSVMTDEQRRKTPLRPVDMLIIAPSERLDDIASRNVGSLPSPVRALLSGIGATEARGAALASYLLFESSYTRELMLLGQRDAFAQKDEVLKFFALEEVNA